MRILKKEHPRIFRSVSVLSVENAADYCDSQLCRDWRCHEWHRLRLDFGGGGIFLREFRLRLLADDGRAFAGEIRHTDGAGRSDACWHHEYGCHAAIQECAECGGSCDESGRDERGDVVGFRRDGRRRVSEDADVADVLHGVYAHARIGCAREAVLICSIFK